MKIAIVSDIHSNIYALRSVLSDIRSRGISDLIFLGDLFGYYPWAYECYIELKKWNIVACIKGNHDLIVERPIEKGDGSPLYVELAQHNREQLLATAPDSIEWLQQLGCIARVSIHDRNICLCHGTPDDPVNGRFYSNDGEIFPWFPLNDDILLLGQTHYPLIKRVGSATIFNPGSIGQPRDGNVNPSYGILDVQKNVFTHHRTQYDVGQTCGLLKDMQWNEYAISALVKNYKGNLKA